MHEVSASSICVSESKTELGQFREKELLPKKKSNPVFKHMCGISRVTRVRRPGQAIVPVVVATRGNNHYLCVWQLSWIPSHIVTPVCEMNISEDSIYPTLLLSQGEVGKKREGKKITLNDLTRNITAF